MDNPGEYMKKPVLNLMLLLTVFAVAATTTYFTQPDTGKARAENFNFDRDILPIFTKSNVFFKGSPACITCHQSVEKGYHELDLSSYDGILIGADTVEKSPGVSVIGQPKAGKITNSNQPNWSKSKLRGRMRSTRMPPGWEWDISEGNRDTPEILAIAAWIKAGATEKGFTKNFKKPLGYGKNKANNVRELFRKPNVFFEGSQSCVQCHQSVEKGYHELDLSSYKGVMIGADTVEKSPGVSVVGQPKAGKITSSNKPNWGKSKLKGRLRNTRMPPGWEWDITEANRDTLPIAMIAEWIEHGAPNGEF